MSKAKLLRNSFTGIAQVILTAGLTLVSVPVFIKTLGLELYGIFAVVSVVGNLNFLVNFGLNSALLVYVAKQGKCKESDLDIAVTRIILLALILIISTIAVSFSNLIIRDILKIPEGFLSESRKLFYLLILSNAFLLIGQTYTATIDALQKIYITNICQFIYSAIYWIGIITVVKLGGGLPLIGEMAFIAALIWFIIIFIFSRRLWGRLDLKDFRREFGRVAKKQITFGAKVYMSGLIGFLFEPFSKILLSNFIGLSAVGLYEIGLKVKGQVNGIFSKAIYPLLPFIAKNEENKTLKDRLFDLFNKLLLIAIPASLIIAFILTILVKLWIGVENYEQASVFVITLTVIVLLLSFPVLPIYQYLVASNKAGKTIVIQSFSVIVNTILFMGLFRHMGLYTIIIANLGGYLASFALCIYYQKKFIEKNYYDERIFYLKLLLLGLTSLIICLVLSCFIKTSLLDVIIYPIVIIGVFILSIRKMRLIREDDLDRYFSPMPSLNSILKAVFLV